MPMKRTGKQKLPPGGSVAVKSQVKTTEELPSLNGFLDKVSAGGVIWTSWGITIGPLIYFPSTEPAFLPYELLAVTIFHLVLWLQAHVLLPRLQCSQGLEKSVLSVFVVALVIFELLIPHRHFSSTFQRIPTISATYASGAVMQGARAMTVWAHRHTDEFKSWNGWQFQYFMFGCGWHDIRSARYIPHPNKRTVMAKEATLQFGVAVLTGLTAASILHLGKPWDVKLSLDLGTIVSMGIRWLSGCAMMISVFFIMDGLYLAAYTTCNGCEVDSIFGDWSKVNSLKAMWANYWNRPVGRMLASGVYKPLAPMLGTNVAKVAVFLVSGLGHVYGLNCCGGPVWVQLSMLFFFLAQVPCLAVEQALQLRGKVYVFLFGCLTAPLFLEPFLITAGF